MLNYKVIISLSKITNMIFKYFLRKEMIGKMNLYLFFYDKLLQYRVDKGLIKKEVLWLYSLLHY